MKVNIIVAYCKNKGIGLKNQLPWKIKEDLAKFQKLTIGESNNAVVMGKNTWQSLNINYLKSRDNLILSTSLNIDKKINTNYIKSFQDYTLLKKFLIEKKYDEIWIIGGEKIYDYFLNQNNCDNQFIVSKIYVTYIDKNFECDTFFPEIDLNKFKFISKEVFKTNNNFNLFNIIYERN
jgi:dihydrofolate reductase